MEKIDIVQRLRSKNCCSSEHCNCDEAADEIERLREALLKIADWNGTYGPYPEANSDEWGPMAIITARQAVTPNSN